MLHHLGIPLLGFALLATVPSFAKDANSSNVVKGPKTKVESLYKYNDKIMEDIRGKIMADAVDAIVLTNNALYLLEKDKPKEAIENINSAISKLELVLKKDPSMGLKPVYVSKEINKLIANASMIEAEIKAAKEHLEKGELQEARMLLAPLESDITLSVISIPLGIYAKTLRTVIPMIEEKKIFEAKDTLHSLLGTLIVKETITPLPPLFAQALLVEAEYLVENEARTDEENALLIQIFQDAHEQLKISELLGYGSKKDFKSMHETINEIEKNIEDGKD